MRRNPQTLCFLGSVLGIFLMSAAMFLSSPASYLKWNRGDLRLEFAAFVLFWTGVLLGALLQLMSLIFRKRETRDFGKQYRKSLEKLPPRQRIRRYLFKNRISVIMAGLFVIGLAGSTAELIYSQINSWHVFLFLSLTVLGLFEYMAFNSLNFLYAVQRSGDYEA